MRVTTTSPLFTTTVTEELVHAFRERVHCPCGGEMQFNGTVATTNPPRYCHTCGDCGDSRYFSKQYPCIEFKPANNPQTEGNS